MDKKVIANRIAELREKKNISERQMSRELGHSPSYISGILRNKGLPALETLEDICEYFEISLADFLNQDYKGDVSTVYITKRIKELVDEEDLSTLLKILKHLDKDTVKRMIQLFEDYKNDGQNGC